MENVRSELILVLGKKEIVIATKTGCANLGSKDYNGDWQLLPGVNYVLYAPDVTDGTPIQDQFHLFTREDFLNFWENLGLLRFKVSGAMRKRVANQLGADEKITTEKYADVVSIQSFTNSGKKYPLVMEKLKTYT